jgi:hypothetical protein
MPVLVVAVVMFVLFLVMGVLATIAVICETQDLPGSVVRFHRAHHLPQK